MKNVKLKIQKPARISSFCILHFKFCIAAEVDGHDFGLYNAECQSTEA